MVFHFNDIADTVLPLSTVINIRCLGRFIIVQVMYINNFIANELLIYATEEQAKSDIVRFENAWAKALTAEAEKQQIGFATQAVGFVQEQEDNNEEDLDE